MNRLTFNSVLPKNTKPTIVAAKKKIIKKRKKKSRGKGPRILKIPEVSGGIIPFLIPAFAGLSAIGTLAGGAAAITQAVKNSQFAERQLQEAKRHNETVENLMLMRKRGFGLNMTSKKKKKKS